MNFSSDLKISCIVATYNREKYIVRALESLGKQSVDKRLFEIIIIDNNCTDNTKAVCNQFIKEHPELNITYITEPAQGLSHARNCGIKNALSDLLTFVDDDAYLSEDFLKICTDFFNDHPDVAVIGGKILLHYESVKPSWVTVYHESLFGYFNPGDTLKEFRNGRYPRGSNMTFRKKVFEKYGSFNTLLGRIGNNMLGAEEKEIFSRISHSKEKVIYVPEAIVYHFVPAERTTQDFIRKQSLGIGQSERIRTRSAGYISFCKRILQESYKWAGTLILAGIYLFRSEISKARMIVFFRYYITKGLLSN